jgi:hypothetical protein
MRAAGLVLLGARCERLSARWCTPAPRLCLQRLNQRCLRPLSAQQTCGPSCILPFCCPPSCILPLDPKPRSMHPVVSKSSCPQLAKPCLVAKRRLMLGRCATRNWRKAVRLEHPAGHPPPPTWRGGARYPTRRPFAAHYLLWNQRSRQVRLPSRRAAVQRHSP